MRAFGLAAVLVMLLPVFFAGCGDKQSATKAGPRAGPPMMPGDPGHPLTGTQEDAKKLGRGPGSAQFEEGQAGGRSGGPGAGPGGALPPGPSQ